MSQPTSEAAAQPALTPQTSAVETTKSSDNVTGAQLRQTLLKNELAAKAAATTEHVTPPVATPAPTQSVENPPAGDSETAEQTQSDTPPLTEAQHMEAMPDSVLSKLSSLDPETQKLVRQAMEQSAEEARQAQQTQVDKRIGKERAKRGDSERIAEQALQEVQALRAQLQQSQQQAPAPQVNPSSPLANIHDLNALQAKRNEAINVMGIVDDALAMNPSADKITVDGQEWERSKLIDLKRNARDLLIKDIPDRQVQLQHRDQANQTALKSFPYLSDPATPEYSRASQYIAQNRHWLQNLPNALEIVAMQIEGEKAMAARKTVQSVTLKPAATVQRASSDQLATSAGSAPERVSADGRTKKQLDAIQQKVSGSSNVTAAQARANLKAADQLRTSR